MKKVLTLFCMALLFAGSLTCNAYAKDAGIPLGDLENGYDIVTFEDVGTEETKLKVSSKDVASLDLVFSGDLSYIEPGEIPADAILIRTTQQSNSLEMTFSNDTLSYEVSYVDGEELALSPDEGTLAWDYDQGSDNRLRTVELSNDNGAMTDFAAVRLEDKPLHIEVWGVSDPEGDSEAAPVRFGVIDEDTTSLNMGTVIADSGDYGWLAMVNYGTDTFSLDEGEVTGTGHYLALFDLDAEDDAIQLELGNDTSTAPPAVTLLAQTDQTISEAGGSFDIVFGSPDQTVTVNYVWAKAVDLGSDTDARAGIPDMESADLADVDDAITGVYTLEELTVASGDFTLEQSADVGEYITLASLDIPIPAEDSGDRVAMPLVWTIPFFGDEVETFDPELAEQLGEETEDLSSSQLEEVLREYLEVTKKWSTGESATFGLDNATYADAFDLLVEEDEDSDAPELFLTVRLIIVNGGTAGDYDTVTVDGATYIVLYDGVADDRFADPLLIRAEDPASGTDDSSSGCSVGAFAPAGLLLALPLIMAFKR